MLDKLKKLKELKELQKTLAQEKVTVEKDGVTIMINGKLEIEDISISPDIDKDRLEVVLKDALNQAIKKIQMAMAQKMSGMQDFF